MEARGDAALADAERILARLRSIQRVLRAPIQAATRRHTASLTAAQALAVQILVEHARQARGGLSLSDLSKRMGLVHSTVSGIVTRLERHGLVQRSTRPDDRRFVSIELAPQVAEWVGQGLRALRLQPLAAAIGRATEDERTAILRGLEVLERLLDRS